MNEALKLSDEQLQEIRELQGNVDAAIRQYGLLHLQKRVLDAELVAVEQTIEQHEQTRINIVQKIQDYFGSTGTINMATGEFVADKK